MQRVTKLIDIKAPCQEVFNTVVNVEKRMQLSPLWGLSRLLEVEGNYPVPGIDRCALWHCAGNAQCLSKRNRGISSGPVLEIRSK